MRVWQGRLGAAGMAHNDLSDIHSYLVPVDGSEASFHGLAAACELAKRNKATVHILHVIEVPRSVALDAEIEGDLQRGEEILDRAERIASDHGVTAVGDLLQARQAGHAIVDEAVERRVDVILIGVEYRRPLGQFRLGRLPEYVLEHATTQQVWLIRFPVVMLPELTAR